MRNTKWNLKPIPRDKDIKIGDIPIDNDVLKILYSRGIKTKKEIYNFLNPKLDNLGNPYDLQDMENAIKIITEAVKENKNIWIYGDYDVDGITSTSILYLSLKEIGAKNINFYIPIRDEGYGLNNEALKKIKDAGGDLVITVDCGIVSFNEIEFANSINLPIIVTDHHNLQGKNVPKALAVINPKRKENKFKIDFLAGVGTIFMVILALFEFYGKKQEAYKYLDLVSIGTIADIVPLLEDNRIFVKHGLDMLPFTKNKGLSYLLYKLFKNNDIPKTEYSTYDIGFIIAPVFNAAGRLTTAKTVVTLLISDNMREIEAIVAELINRNFERKELQNNIIEMVEKNIQEKKLSEDFIIVDYSPKYHHGVIGIAASKIVDNYYKPVIIMEEKSDEGVAVGSCRSIENFNILEALQSMPELFLKFGGHSGAAGFTIPTKNIELFKKKINDFARKKLTEKDFIRKINIDKQIPIQKISYEFFKTMELLKPFGFGNPSPTFLTRGVLLENVRYIGENKNHIMFDFKQKGFHNRNAVWFGSGEYFREINNNLFYDIVFKLKVEEYQGKLYTKVYIDDIKKSDLKNDTFNFYHSLYSTTFPLRSIFQTNLEVNENIQITIKKEFDQLALFQGRKFIGRLDYNISNLLILLNENYNWNFKIEIEKLSRNKNGIDVEIILKRDYDFICYDYTEIGVFSKIKKFILGNMEYNSKEKEILSTFIKESKNLFIVNYFKKNYINSSLENILLTLGIYFKGNTDKKCEIILNNIKDFPYNNSFIKNYFDVNTKYKKNENYSFTIFWINNFNEKLANIIKKDFMKSNKKFAIIMNNKENKDFNFSEFNLKILKIFENIKVIDNTIEIPSNVVFLEKLSKDEIKKAKNIYTKYLPIKEKIKLKKLLTNNEIISSDSNIYEIL